MGRIRSSDVLRQHAAGVRDFRGVDLSGLRFCGANLSGADFSEAILCSTDFSDAQLQYSNFSKSKCGKDGFWLFLTLLAVFGLGSMASLIFSFILVTLFDRFTAGDASAGFIQDLVLLMLVNLFIVFRGPSLPNLMVASVAGSHFDINGSYYLGFGLGFASWFAGSIAGHGSSSIIAAGAGALACACSVTYFFTVNSGIDLMTGIGMLSITLSSLALSYWRSSCELQVYVKIRGIGIDYGVFGGTCFRGADLRDSNFTDAQLDWCSFESGPDRLTQLERVCWKGAQGLEKAKLCGTTLIESRIRRLLIHHPGAGNDLSGANLQGAYLAEANLQKVNFSNSNLSRSILKGAHLEGANLAGAQCLGSDFRDAHLTGACLEAWNIDSSTNLHNVNCAYVYLLQSHDAHGNRLDDHCRDRLPHDPSKSFEAGDFEAYFKKVIEEVKLLIRNGIDPNAFKYAFQAVMDQHPQITPQSLRSVQFIGNDVMATLEVQPGTDKASLEHTFDQQYLPIRLENAELKGRLEAEIRRADDHKENMRMVIEAVAKLPYTTTHPPIHITNTSTMNDQSIKTGNGSFVNTGNFQPSGGLVNLGALSEQAKITIEAVPHTRLAADQPSLQELLFQLKDSIEADGSISPATKVDALTEVTELAHAAQDPQKNASLARRSINALKGLNDGLEESVKLATTVTTLIARIAPFFLQHPH